MISSDSHFGQFIRIFQTIDYSTLQLNHYFASLPSRVSSVATDGLAGKVNFSSTDGKIEMTDIWANSLHSVGGNVTLKAKTDIITGDILSWVSDGSGKAGDIKLNAENDILTRGINSSHGLNGIGGDVSLFGSNISAGYIRSDSQGGVGGDIKIDASKFVKITDSVNIDGNNYSIYTHSADVNGQPVGVPVTIKHSSTVINNELRAFAIGDASINGSAGGVSDGVLGFVKGTGFAREIPGNYVFNNIKFIAPEIVASGVPQIDVSNVKDTDIFFSAIIGRQELINRTLTYSLVKPFVDFSLQQLQNIAKDSPGGEQLPALNTGNARKLLNAGLNFYLYLYGISTPRTKGHFIAQSLHETGSFGSFSEISGPGRGLLQLTGDDNIQKFGNYVGISGLVNKKDLIGTNIALNILSAMWFWSVYGKGGSEDLNAIAQNDPPNEATVNKISRIVRGNDRNPNVPLPEDAHFARRLEYFMNAVRTLSIT